MWLKDHGDVMEDLELEDHIFGKDRYVKNAVRFLLTDDRVTARGSFWMLLALERVRSSGKYGDCGVYGGKF